MNNYTFILENLEFLTVDVTLFNLSKMYPERAKIGVLTNQNLINLKRQILMDISENKHNLIYFTPSQWDEIKDYIELCKDRY
jgi:Cdc6-like AAA superfamily ATPase